ncbi:16649_t:CDS:2 [Funneliformis geosporum]|uniref:16649_t:CDS:1 n=1 Tax=Funneliformis geosporum TaxID=1117311 RepID=A0A9W4SBV1_9GLOM|nr:16649_t:CDS:2 [Funneliformis geosporum]
MRTRIQQREIKRPIFPKIKERLKQSSQKEVKILNLAVHLERLTAQLSDGRELNEVLGIEVFIHGFDAPCK